MAKRKNISKKVRFEVFKRDSFTCQYCGKSAPDTVLEVDHIIPVSKGGDNDISNLITSCFDCNRGKSNKKLTDNQSLKMQKKELDKLNKRREQLEMMSQWRMELLDLEHREVEEIVDTVNQELDIDLSLSPSGEKNMIKLIKKYGFEEVMESTLISFEQYEDYEIAFKKIAPIINNRKKCRYNPVLKELYYARGIIRNRFSYINEHEALMLLEECYELGVPIDSMKKLAIRCDNYSDWKECLTILQKHSSTKEV